MLGIHTEIEGRYDQSDGALCLMAHPRQDLDQVLPETFLPLVLIGALAERHDFLGFNPIEGDERKPLLADLDHRYVSLSTDAGERSELWVALCRRFAGKSGARYCECGDSKQGSNVFVHNRVP